MFQQFIPPGDRQGLQGFDGIADKHAPMGVVGFNLMTNDREAGTCVERLVDIVVTIKVFSLDGDKHIADQQRSRIAFTA